MPRLQDKYALITGGTSGIGLETARQFLAEGAMVAITGRSEAALLAAGEELGDSVLLFQSDAGVSADQRVLAQRIAQQWPRLDVLYANAGDVTHRPLQEWDESAYDRLMGINLKGPFFLIQSLLPLLANPSSVILCDSVSAHIGLPQSSAYASSKAGVLSLALTLSGELWHVASGSTASAQVQPKRLCWANWVCHNKRRRPCGGRLRRSFPSAVWVRPGSWRRLPYSWLLTSPALSLVRNYRSMVALAIYEKGP